ncbi:hypothetical protein PT974_10542 [Cladobotryum mycophilum]|uniref:Uncharacterized protein n=1 Tax=Cladobotryum mycophilum TaxID=491253 RepID=A0ABR0SAN0_9HYPO
MSGFNDQAKLRDALELARSFGIGNDKGPKKKGGGRPNHHPLLPRSSRGPTPAPQSYEDDERRQPAEGDYYYGRPPSKDQPPSNIPLPSQHNYAGLTSFQAPRQEAGGKQAIGSIGLDFLRRADQKTTEIPAQGCEAETSPAPSTVANLPSGVPPESTTPNASAMRGPSFSRTEFPTELSESSSETESPTLKTGGSRPRHANQQRLASNGSLTESVRSEGKLVPGNILDTFFSLVSKNPSLGQEIEDIANRLPNAMNLNAPAKDHSAVLVRQEGSDPKEVNCIGRCTGAGIGVAHEEGCPFHNTPPVEAKAAGLSTADIQQLRPHAATFDPKFNADFYEKLKELKISKRANALGSPPAKTKHNNGPAKGGAKSSRGLATSMWA